MLHLVWATLVRTAMADELKGGCLCGAVTFRTSGEPLGAMHCHCRDCQRATGSGFVTAYGVPRTQFTLEQGNDQLGAHQTTADSGGTVTREFCRDCGSPLFSYTTSYPGDIWIKAGTLDDPDEITPAASCFTWCATAWAPPDPQIANWPRLPEV